MERSPGEKAVIVLGAKLLRSGLPNSVGRTRMEKGVELFGSLRPACRVIVCGGLSGGPRSEAEAFRDYGLGYAAKSLGRGASLELQEKIFLECESTNTYENSRAALRLMVEAGIREALLVTDALHLPRAWIVFHRGFKRHGLKVRPAPAWGVLRRFHNSRNHKAALKWAVREIAALVKLVFYDLPIGLRKKAGP